MTYIYIVNKFTTGTDAESDDNLAEEEASLRLPQQLVEWFRSEIKHEEFNGFSDLD